MLENLLFGGPVSFMIVCELALIVAFSTVYQRDWKEHLGRNILLAVLLFAAVKALDYYLVDFNTASTALEAPFCFTAAWIYAVTAFSIPKKEALYCTVWSYLLTEVTTQTIMPVTEILSRLSERRFYRLEQMLVYVIVILGMVCFIRKILAPHLQTNRHYHAGRQKLLFSVLVGVIYLCMSNYQFIFWLLGGEPETGSNMITVFRLVVGIAGIFSLYLQNSIEKRQRAEQELEMVRQLWYRQQDQYRLSQENIDLINRKCHDLKYQMAALRQLHDEQEITRQLKELEHSALIYDSVIKTGHPVLDTVLTEKSLYCEAHQIQMTCMADASGLGFVENVDLYTMFGNALDNAIESVTRLKEPEKRVIQVAVFQEKNLLMIRVRNYCEEKLEFNNGLPVSTKKEKGYHGFGLKSIQYTAEKYGGGIVCQVNDHLFSLQILLPVPTEA